MRKIPSKARLLDIFDNWLWNIKPLNSKSSHGLVLMYHHVTDDFVDIDKSCKCSVRDFKNGLIRLQEQGYEFVDINIVESFLTKQPNHRYATVTFDDVPSNVITNAIPILRDLKIPYTLFITTSFTHKEGYISEEQLRELIKDPLCTIGAHTVTHPQLCKAQNHWNEIIESKQHLEQLLERPVEYLAYPFGKHSSVTYKTQREAKRAGFKCAFGTIEAPLNSFTSMFRYYLPRTILK